MSVNPYFEHGTPSSRKRLIDEAFLRFLEQNPDEETSVDNLYSVFNEAGYQQCRSCYSDDIAREHGSRECKCLNCGQTFSFTSGTFLEDVKNVHPYMGAIYLLGEGFRISANHYYELTTVAKSTAWAILKKVEKLMLANMPENCESIPSHAFLEVFNKRSRFTPAECPPTAEQQAFEEKHPEYPDDRADDQNKEPESAPYSEQQRQILEILTDEGQTFDQLFSQLDVDASQLSSDLTILEVLNLAKRLPGDKYVRHWSPTDPKTKQKHDDDDDDDEQSPREKLILSIIHFITDTVDGISRKYLQFYMAKYWCFMDRLQWTYRSLLISCRDSPPIALGHIRAYVTPLTVEVAPVVA